jgi:hypothetical protein
MKIDLTDRGIKAVGAQAKAYDKPHCARNQITVVKLLRNLTTSNPWCRRAPQVQLQSRCC